MDSDRRTEDLRESGDRVSAAARQVESQLRAASGTSEARNSTLRETYQHVRNRTESYEATLHTREE